MLASLAKNKNIQQPGFAGGHPPNYVLTGRHKILEIAGHGLFSAAGQVLAH